MDNRLWQWFKKHTQKERYRLWSVIVLLLVIITLQSMAVVALRHNLRVVIVPATLSDTAWLDHDKVSSRYIKAMAEYLSLMYLTTTPRTEEAHLATLLRYSAPESHGALKAAWRQRHDQEQQNDIATLFSPEWVSVDGLTATVSGELRTVVGKEEVLRIDVRYQFTFQMVHGQLQLVAVRELINQEEEEKL